MLNMLRINNLKKLNVSSYWHFVEVIKYYFKALQYCRTFQVNTPGVCLVDK